MGVGTAHRASGSPHAHATTAAAAQTKEPVAPARPAGTAEQNRRRSVPGRAEARSLDSESRKAGVTCHLPAVAAPSPPPVNPLRETAAATESWPHGTPVALSGQPA